MFKAILPAIIICLMSNANRLHAVETPMDLSQFQWKNRLLFLFAPNRSHPLFDALQKSIAIEQAEVADRDLVVFVILESGPSRMDMTDLDSQVAQSLRDKFDVRGDQFAVILVGKDGGIKLNQQDETRLDDIFGLIDSMPMRREEMRQKSRISESVNASPDKPTSTD